MNKNKIISDLTNILAIALRHKIGAIVNSNEIYSQKYAKDADILINEARKTVIKVNWNNEDKQEIKEQLKHKLKKELESKDFIDNKKYDLMSRYIEETLKNLSL